MGKSDREFDLSMMRKAARLALRGVGRVEPNPPVGCVIVELNTSRIIGEGWHTHFGGPHAEICALNRCREAGEIVRGAIAYITFEPCNHHGKTGPCTEALIEAGIKRVVIAGRDPNSEASGGVERLREAGVVVDLIDCEEAIRLTFPFVKVVTMGLPWVVVKWAQTIDGKIATRTGDSQWISNVQSRAAVHRIRARVDAILTGIGTVIADDPMLTARNTRRIHKRSRRIVIDPSLRIDLKAKIVQTAGEFPTTVVCNGSPINGKNEKIRSLEESGVEVLGIAEVSPAQDDSSAQCRLSMSHVLQTLRQKYEISTVLIEAGPGIIGGLLHEERLVDQLIVYVAPILVGDSGAIPPLRDRMIQTINEAQAFRLDRVRRVGEGDVELIYGRGNESQSSCS